MQKKKKFSAASSFGIENETHVKKCLRGHYLGSLTCNENMTTSTAVPVVLNFFGYSLPGLAKTGAQSTGFLPNLVNSTKNCTLFVLSNVQNRYIPVYLSKTENGPTW
eukprot:SAG11_NODE_9171_length_935_cov_4.571770_1_plen_107_part_00